MRVLIACEESGIVSKAFLDNGHDSYSCDLIPTSSEDPEVIERHIQGDCLDHIYGDWDLVIGFPPCIHLSSSGARWFKEKRESGVQQEAIEFFLSFTRIKSPWAIENPIGIMSTKFRKPDQIIQPWQFGHPESKSTCLWLSGLSNLAPTMILEKPASGRWGNQTPSGQNKLGPSLERSKLRSKTYLGIAKAMANQWS